MTARVPDTIRRERDPDAELVPSTISDVGGLGIGVVGCGRHGARYARHLAAGEVPGAYLAAIQRRDAATGAEQAQGWRCAFHGTAEALVRDPNVGAVIVATPPNRHLADTLAALERGLPVLLEKPLAHTVADARTLAARAAEPGAPLCAVAYPLRWNPVLREVRARLEEIGPLRSLWIASRHESLPEPGWRDDPQIAGGGVGIDVVPHLGDLAHWLTGAEITGVRADVGRATDSAVESHVQAQATMHGAAADGGAVRVQLEVLRGTAGRSGRIEAVGTLGQLVGDYRLGQLAKIYGKADVPLDLDKAAPPLVGLTLAFVATLAGTPDPDLPSFADGLRGNLLADACYRAAAGGISVVPDGLAGC